MYRAVIFKLLGFTFAMITLPIGTYFMTVNTVFKGLYSHYQPPKSHLSLFPRGSFVKAIAELSREREILSPLTSKLALQRKFHVRRWTGRNHG